MSYLDEFEPFRRHPVLICQYMASISETIQNFTDDHIGNIHQLLYSIRRQLPLDNILYFRKPGGFQFKKGCGPQYFTAASEKRHKHQIYIKGCLELHDNIGNLNISKGSLVVPIDNPNLLRKAPSFKQNKDNIHCVIFTPIFVKHRVASCLVAIIEKNDLKNIPEEMISSLAAFFDMVSGFFSMQEGALILEKELEQKIAFEQLISKLATQHASCPTANIDNVINTTILELTSFAKANYGFIYLFDDDNKNLIRTNCISNGFIIKEKITVSATDDPWKWFINTIKKEGIVNHLCKSDKFAGIPNLEKYQPDITSIIIIPVICLSEKINSIKGFFGIASKEENLFSNNQQLTDKLQVVGTLLTAAIKRRFIYQANQHVQDYLNKQLFTWRQQTVKRKQNLDNLRKQLLENKALLKNFCHLVKDENELSHNEV